MEETLPNQSMHETRPTSSNALNFISYSIMIKLLRKFNDIKPFENEEQLSMQVKFLFLYIHVYLIYLVFRRLPMFHRIKVFLSSWVYLPAAANNLTIPAIRPGYYSQR